MKSGLQPSQLARIWALCDTSKAGELLFPEFALAMHLVNAVLQGDSIPFELQSKTKNEVSSFIDAINLSIASESQTDLTQPRTPFDQYISPGVNGLQQQSTGYLPQTSFGVPLQSQITGGNTLSAQMTGSFPQTSFGMPAQNTGGMQFNQQMTGGRLQPQNTGFMPQTSFNAPIQAQNTGNAMLQFQATGGLQPGALGQNNTIMPQTTGGFNNVSGSQGLMGNTNQQMNLTGGPIATQQPVNPLQQQLTGGVVPNLASQSTGNIALQQPSVTGPNVMPQFGNGTPPQNLPYGNLSSTLPSQSTGNIALQSQPTGYLPPSGFNPTMPLTAQKTGFGNNEIYSQNNFGTDFTAQNSDSINPEEKSLFYKIFETYDTNNKGLLDASSAVEIFRKSGLNRSDLEHIWNLCDVNNSGQLNKQEFALGMHLVYRKLNGFQLPNRLPLSLIPSSTKIIDNLKDQLKSVPNKENKQKATKVDALSYKNNDDEALPSFRNRRKVFNKTETPSPKISNTTPTTTTTTTRSEPDSKREKIAALRNAIKEKRALLDSQRAPEVSTSEQDELRRVEVLKSELKNLPQFPNVENDAVPVELKGRFDHIISKLPQIFSRIADIDNEISKAKINLFKLKNPSSLSGTGVNGEITEEDRKKATSKALLKARMDALTGKHAEPTESLEEEEKKYNFEIQKIQDESSKNQHIIDDIRHSISEISASLKSSMNGGAIGGNPADFGKWEFGVGLQPEVRNFIENLNSNKLTVSDNSTSHSQVPSAASGNNFENTQVSRGASAVAQPHSAETQKPSSYSNVSEEEEDEEERQLREELAKLKLKKKADKEKRLAELRRQLEEAQADSDEDEGASIPAHEQTGTPKTANINQAPTATYNSARPVVEQPPTVSAVPPAASAAPPLSSVSTGGRNPFFKQKDPSSSSFDSKAAETQRRLQRGLDDDDDDGWSDDDAQTGAASSAKATEQVYAKQETAAEPQHTNVTPASSVPVAPPIPPLGAAVDTTPAALNVNSEPVPVAPPLPQVGATGAPPVPIAPPLPQINSSAGFSIPPPPPLPGQSAAPGVPPQVSAEVDNLDNAQDSDDVLSIPESVASVEGTEYQPSGIPPPPPLP